MEFDIKTVDRWDAPEEGGVPIISMPNVPLPLHLCAPRTILGRRKWDEMRKACYEKADNTCEACGKVCLPRERDAHELYDIDFKNHTMTFNRCVCLCKACVDEDTEVLTEDGWKKIPQVTLEDKVACWAEDNSISFEHPTDTITTRPTTAVKITRKDKELYFSPNHRLPLRVASKQSSTYGEVKVIHAEDYKASHYYNWITSGQNKKEEFLTPLERLYIAIEADGNLCYDKENPRGHERQRDRGDRYGTKDYRYTYCVRLGKARKIERFEKLLDESGVKFQQGADQAGEKCWTIWLNVDAKHFNRCFSINMGKDKAQEFLEELIFWDGTYEKSTTRWYTNKLEEADFVQGVAAQCGMRANIMVVNRLGNLRKGAWQTPYDRLTYAVSILSNQVDYCGEEMTPTTIPWNKPMYCLTVPTSYFVARRDGLVFVTGNCHLCMIHSGRLLTLFEKKNPLVTKEGILRDVEAGFSHVFNYNQEHPKDQLRLYYTFVSFAENPELQEGMLKLIDRYHIKFYRHPKNAWDKTNWGKWRLIIDGEERPTPYADQTEWEKAMRENNKTNGSQIESPFKGAEFDALKELARKGQDAN